MYVIIDHRPSVTEAYASSLASEGVASLGLQPREFREWFNAASEADVEGVQSVVVGEFEGRASLSDFIRRRTPVPILALSEVRNLATTLDLFSAGVDDVVRTPVHVREIIARSNAIWRRINRLNEQVTCNRMKVFFDGRDVEVDGVPMILPRRERRILEFLARNAHRRVSKTQIFNAVYGPFEDLVDEVVVEGHISKLRKKLRLRLGRDVIDAKRYLGYQFIGDRRDTGVSSMASSPVATIPHFTSGDRVRDTADFAEATLALQTP
jgi:DNA-binding response OmpR family regulator